MEHKALEDIRTRGDFGMIGYVGGLKGFKNVILAHGARRGENY
jgi:hypothetical protein